VQISKHVRSLNDQQIAFESTAGSITRLGRDQLPILEGLSIRRLVLTPNAIREPHWHANANELGYCVRGQALVTIVGNHGSREVFVIGIGEMFFFPSGTVHAIENTGDTEAEFILAFSNEDPEDFSLSGAFDVMPDPVLLSTFEWKPQKSLSFGRLDENTPIFELGTRPKVEKQVLHPNKLKFRIEKSAPRVASPAGSARTAQAPAWPFLDGISMFSVRINEIGLREPHWHPETAEMGYVIERTGQMTVLDPDGSADTYSIRPGDVYFVPPAYPHHIENTGTGTLHILIFFSRSAPQDIGYRAAAAGYSRDVMAAELGLFEHALPPFPIDIDDPLIIARL
jgi:oxalate decarboxylase